MKNKICDRVGLQHIVNQYVNKRSNYKQNEPLKRFKSYSVRQKSAIDVQKKRSMVANMAIMVISPQQKSNDKLSNSQQANSLLTIKAKMPMSSRLFSHDYDELAANYSAKQTKYQSIHPQMHEFYGKANLRIRWLKKQAKRQYLTHNHHFTSLFNRTLHTTHHPLDPLHKDEGNSSSRQRSNSLRRLRVNSRVVQLEERKQREQLGKTGLQFYRTLYK